MTHVIIKSICKGFSKMIINKKLLIIFDFYETNQLFDRHGLNPTLCIGIKNMKNLNWLHTFLVTCTVQCSNVREILRYWISVESLNV